MEETHHVLSLAELISRRNIVETLLIANLFHVVTCKHISQGTYGLATDALTYVYFCYNKYVHSLIWS